MRNDVKEAFFGAKIFYFATTLAVLGVCCVLKNPLKQNFCEENYFPIFSLLALITFSSWLICTAGKDPGFFEESDQVMYEMNFNEKKDSDFLLVEGIEKASDNSFSSNGILNEFKSNSSDGFPPEKRFCEACKVIQPYRSKHCMKCERCILKYDHHCFWIGTIK